MDTIEKIHKCDYVGCDKSYKRPYDLKVHKRTHTGEKPYKCEWDGCNMAFIDRGSLTKHKRIHSNEFPYMCDECDYRSNVLADLKRHKYIHKDKIILCTYEGCKYRTTTTHALKVHNRIHTGEKSYSCDYSDCNYVCSSASMLKSHKHTHSEDRPYKCTECKMSFKSLGNLKKHIKTHEEKTLKCNELGCNFTCHRTDSLKMHLIVHTKEKPFECKYCGKTFPRADAFKNHSRIHTKERPFKCEECGDTFPRPETLKVHMVVHTGVKNYHCMFEGCGLSFAHGSTLKGHMLTHTGIKPYVCTEEGCCMVFSRSSGLKYHQERIHSEQGKLNRKKEESRIAKLLESNNIPFKREHLIDFTCLDGKKDGSRCFIDFVIESYNKEGKLQGFIFIEVDEHQHDSYAQSCELRRMTDVNLSLTLGGNIFPILFIRYNPHAFKINNLTKRFYRNKREVKLLELITSINFNSPFSVIYMYYDTCDGELDIFSDSEYNDSFKAYVSNIIT